MTVAFGAIGTGANGSTSVAPSYPSGITVGQLLTCQVSSGATNSEVPTTPSGWFLLGTNANTTGSFALDTGPRRMTVFGRVADGSESGTLTVNITNGDTCRGTIARWTSSIGSGWALQAGSGNDSSAGTGVSIACGSINWATGDCALVATGQLIDSSTQSSQSLTASGTTFGTRTNRAATAVTTGNDHRHSVDTFAAVTTGGGSATTTWAYTASSASTQSAAVIVRIREIGDVAEALTVTASQTETATLNSAQAEALTLTATQDSTLVYAPQRVNEVLVGSAVAGALFARRAGLAEPANQTYNKQRDEVLTVTEASVESSVLPRSVAESLTVVAEQTGTTNAVWSKQRDEVLTVTDAQDRTLIISKQRDEVLTVADSSIVPGVKSVNEALIGTPGARWAIWLRAEDAVKRVDEALTVTDSQSEIGTFNKTVAEALTVTASQVQLGFNALRSEALTVTDAQSETGIVGVAVAESLTVTAAQTGTNGSIKSRDESLTVTDLQTGVLVFNAACAEVLLVTDAQTASFQQAAPRTNPVLVGERREGMLQPWAMDAVLSSERDEALTVVDAQAALRVVAASVAESLLATAAQTGSTASSQAQAEFLSITDSSSASTGVIYVKQVEETLTLVEASAKTIALNVTVDEVLSVAAGQIEATQLYATANESLTVADSATLFMNPVHEATRNEVLAVADVQSASLNHPIFVKQQQEVLMVTAVQSQTPSLNSSRAESLVVSDAYTTATEFHRFMDEVLSVTDSSFLIIGPYSDLYRYDVPAVAGAMRYDVPGGGLRYDVPADILETSIA